MDSRIPCTIAMLTFNSAKTLARALESVVDVAEVIIADGGSTDQTIEIARRYGRTVVRQDPANQDSSGRLIDYGGAREQLRQLANQPWIMQLDSDEYASTALVEDLRSVLSADSGNNGFWIQARYEYRGRLVDCATTYPMRFPRVYRRAASSGYAGVTHERAIVEGTFGELGSYFVIPWPSGTTVLRKWSRYLGLDVAESRQQTEEVLHEALRHRKSQIRWFLRDLWHKQLRSTCDRRLPMRFEFLRGVFYCLRYGVSVVEVVRRQVRGRRPHGPHTVDAQLGGSRDARATPPTS